jgi:hypothetical protein
MPAPQATLASQDAAAPAAATTARTGAGGVSDASDAPVAALANDLQYTLTVGQARELFAAHNRKVPAERTVQNYCIEGSIASQKIRTTYGSEWLINESSLFAFIEDQPIVVAALQQPYAVHESAAHAPQQPQESHDLATQAAQSAAVPATASGATTALGGATDASTAVLQSQVHAPIGETRTLAAVLIENAKLLATIEGKDQVIRGKEETIAELKDDRAFLRDEVRESRQQRKDVKDIASRMLEAMQTIAIAGKLPPASAQDDSITARVIRPDQSTSPHT